MYASFYDRYSNRVFFVRNDEAVNKFFAGIYPPIKTEEPQIENKEKSQSCPRSNSLRNLLRNGKNSRSYKEPKNSSLDLSKDKSHASNEIVKKMIEVWTAIVQEGRGQVNLEGKIAPFLKKAFTDKFDSCLQKWKEYCISIARSKFLMGEKTSFKADLEWALKFESIRKILNGNYYGIGDRDRKLTPEELEEKEKQLEEQKKAKELEKQRSLLALEEEIKNSSDEPDSVKNFRIKWLRSFGEKNYREFLADCEIKLGEKETDLIIQPRERIKAIKLESHWNTELLLDQPFKRVKIYHCITDLMGKPLVFDRWFGDFEEVKAVEQGKGKNVAYTEDFDKSICESQNDETNQLRANLKENIPEKEYPVWLDGIKVQTLKPDGILVVTFRDRLTSDYARIKFSEKIIKSAVELWGEVSGLIIHEESDYLSIRDGNEYFEMDERIFLGQAVPSFIVASFTGARQGRAILNDAIPY